MLRGGPIKNRNNPKVNLGLFRILFIWSAVAYLIFVLLFSSLLALVQTTKLTLKVRPSVKTNQNLRDNDADDLLKAV